jgi:histidinol-phosphate aminotransferase
MEQIVSGLKRLGWRTSPRMAISSPSRWRTLAGVNSRLLKQGVIVRPIGGYGMPNHLRVTIGLAAENGIFLDALEKALHP